MHTSLVVVLLFAAVVAADSSRSPVIGVFGQPLRSGGTYIPASYIKWVESSGGRAVPIMNDAKNDTLVTLANALNGILYIGGASDVNDAAKVLYRLAMEKNQKGDYFPIWGTCLGFEWLLQMTAEDDSVLDRGFDAENISLPLDYTLAAKTSRLFGPAAPQDIVALLSTEPVTMNNHMLGMEPDTLLKNKKLSAFYDILSTNVDRKGRPFVSTIEAKEWPVWGAQYHPEKNAFEQGRNKQGIPYEAIDHSSVAVKTAAYLGRFFVDEARKNGHAFPTPEAEAKALIYNYSPVYTEPTSSSFVQEYQFPPSY